MPAAITAAKAYLRENNPKKALSVLEQAWKIAPHMEIVTHYLAAGGATAQEMLAIADMRMYEAKAQRKTSKALSGSRA